MSHLRCLVVVWGAALCFAACTESANGPATGGRFSFREPLTSDVLRVEITNPTGLAEAEELLQSGAAQWVVGTPRRGDGGFNAPWPWHLDPATVRFAEVTAEACQTVIAWVGPELDYWIEFGQVCIWGVVEARER